MFAISFSTRRVSRSLVAGGAAVALAVAGQSLLVPVPASADPVNACDYQTYVVPAGVRYLTVTAVGAAGKPGVGHSVAGISHGGGVGGLGAKVVARLAVDPGQTLYYGAGSNAIPGGRPPAGTFAQTYRSGGVGGNGSFLATSAPNSTTCVLDDTSSLIVVAAGGGGGGSGGGTGPGGTGGSAGATAADGNGGGSNGGTSGGGGKAGTNSAGGVGGLGGEIPDVSCFCTHRAPSGGASTSVAGGAASAAYVKSSDFGGGGGGGGGYFGGGGGGTDGVNFYGGEGSGAGGGGGGASFPASSSSVAITTTTEAPSLSIVPKYGTTTTLTSSGTPSAPGAPITLSAQTSVIGTNLNIVGGSINFYDRGDPNDPGRQTILLGSVAVTTGSAVGTASLTVSSLSPGVHQLQANYTGFTGLPAGGTAGVDDTDDDRSQSPALTQVISRPQTITFTSVGGAHTAYTSTYTPTATSTSGLPVSFSVDAASGGSCAISGTTVSFLAAGTCIIDADQAGNGTYLPAPQAQQSITVVGADQQAITFTSTPPADLQANQYYQLTATGGPSGQPVTFSVDAHQGCQIAANNQYVSFVGGTCVVHANQAGGNGYAPAAQVDQTVTTQPAPQQVVFITTMPSAPTIGDTYAVRAYATGERVALTLDATSKGCALSNLRESSSGGLIILAGTITYTARGTCVLDGNAPGYGYYAPAPQLQQTATVAGTSQSVSFTSQVPAAPHVGDQYDATTSTSVAGAIVELGTTTPTTCTVGADGSVSFTAIGACTLTADVAGTDTYAPAPQATQTITVAKTPQTVAIVGDPPANPAVGDTYRPQLTGGGSLQPVVVGTSTPTTCTATAGTVTFLAAGTCTVTVDQAGDDTYAAAPELTRDLNVQRAQQQIIITSTPEDPSRVGTVYALQGTAGAGTQPVVITTTTPATCTPVAGTNSVRFIAAGLCTVTLDQAGDTNYTAAAQVSQNVQVQPGVQQITFSSTPGSRVVVGSTYQVIATGGASGNPVTFSVGAASVKICTVDGSGQVTFRRAGTCSVNADQIGDDDYLAAPTASQNISVSTQKANQTISFTSAPPTTSAVGGSYQVTALGGGSTSPVVFSAKPSSAKVCTVTADGAVAFLKPGNCVVYAMQAGDANYRAAARAQQTAKVVK